MTETLSSHTASPSAPAGERWTVSGISPQAKRAAREAAKRERMPLGKWLEEAIRRAAEAEAGRSHRADPGNPRPNRRYF